jgi:hypothetical protein
MLFIGIMNNIPGRVIKLYILAIQELLILPINPDPELYMS